MEAAKLAIIACVIFIIVYSVYRSIGIQLPQFLYNAKSTTARSTFPSVIAGNIGAGTIYGLYIFATKQPLFAISIAVSYVIGLMLAGLLAERIRHACNDVKEVSLIGFIAERHGIADQKIWIIWVSVSVVFLLQLAVEFLAVGDVVSYVFGIAKSESLLIVAGTVASYLVVGGYKSTTVSAHLQAPLVVGTLALIGFFILPVITHEPVVTLRVLSDTDRLLPVGAFFLIAPAVFLSIDNWHRIVAAESAHAARNGFMLGAILCGISYSVLLLAGIINGPGPVPTQGLMLLVPSVLQWIVPTVIVVAILSTVDTEIPPLVAGMPGSASSLARARAYTIILISAVTLTALSLGTILQGIIAAFSSLAVFLPATASAILRRTNLEMPVLYGIPMSVSAAIFMTIFFGEYALAASVVLSVVLYFGLAAIEKRMKTGA